MVIVAPAAMEPTPWTLQTMPKNEAGLCRPSPITAKMTVSLSPITANTAAVTSVICRSSGTRRMCRNPALTSRQNSPRAVASGRDSLTLMLASAAMAATNVIASIAATAPPPNAVYSPAPASGARMRTPCEMLCRAALAAARLAPTSMSLRRPALALPTMPPATP